MSHFAGMEELLQDFLTEAGELLSDVDNKLVELEKRPSDKALLNDIFRGFHTIKGGAGFLNVNDLVGLCHRTENLFDKLRTGELALTTEIMDVIMNATGVVRTMFGSLAQSQLPDATDASLLKALDCALAGEKVVLATLAAAVAPEQADQATPQEPGGPDWLALYHAITGTPAESIAASQEVALPMEMAPIIHAATQVDLAPRAKAPSAPPPAAKETTIRVDTSRLDMVLNLSGEIGLTKNRLTCLRANILQGKTDGDTLKALDEAVSHLDLLVGDLQNAVMKTRMQPIGRLFQKYPRLARDLARQLGKDVELVISGEETEIDKTMIEDLNDPIVHLVRNAVDHGVESTQDRVAAGKPSKSLVKLSAMQSGDHIVIEIADDGKGMRPDTLRRKAVEKGLIDSEAANALDDRQSLNLIFLPGFSTMDVISDVSGRGVGMDVVRTNIQKLNGRIDINSVVGHGTTITISLPLTLAILPVLVVRLGEQPFAIPLSMVREIIQIHPEEIQRVSGRATMVVRDEVLPVRSLSSLIGWPQDGMPSFGVLIQATATNFILAIDGFLGRDDVVIKPLHDIKPKGIAGATLSGDGLVVLVLDIEELLEMSTAATHASMFAA
ncbi:MAG: chemotaxis protein CheA [Betaproteobacteria bacterium CG2_30_59_46]|nr:MAG: chemotaxis protein CheA [Betaproteobacteria bacterium CG2_30_59_46]PIQ13061.1 MAG: chemotaxis protein CheA [Hydrogenophilales bacterium CG18_big_fil_WC_8_21_14_2_50_58_12]PIX99133.1 MAG: chemotaxis protein CheA [Hydrogenophilales bacterium CG_4_10_14_3_um_filter_58_23]